MDEEKRSTVYEFPAVIGAGISQKQKKKSKRIEKTGRERVEEVH